MLAHIFGLSHLIRKCIARRKKGSKYPNVQDLLRFHKNNYSFRGCWMRDWLFIISNDDDLVEAADCGSQKAFHSATERGNSCMSQAYARTLGMTI